MPTSILPRPLFSTTRLCLLALTFVLLAASWQTAQADDFPVPFDPSWKLNLHPEYKGADGTLNFGADGKSMTLNYDFSNGGSFISATRSLDSLATFYSIELTAKGTGGLGLSVVDSTGQTFVFQIGVPGDADKTITLILNSPNQSYGGAKDKVMHFPLKAINILASKTKDSPSGSLEVSEVDFKSQ